jgi:hypothetical protein
MKHPHAHFLIAIANGEQIQCFYHGGWVDVSPQEFLCELSKHNVLPISYRVKPKTININGIEVPEPLREVPPHLTEVWFVEICEPKRLSFIDCLEGRVSLNLGLLHLTREAAMLHQKALLSFTSKKD